MSPNSSRSRSTTLLTLVLLLNSRSALGVESRLTLKNGMTVEGEFSRIGSLAENPLARNVPAGGVATRPVVIVDDGVRRTYFPYRELALAPMEAGTDDAPLRIRQRVAGNSSRVGAVGGVLSATPFDAFGRRVITVSTSKGRKEIVQGITEISRTYTRVQALQGDNSVDWDMRIATSSIPSDVLRNILLRDEDRRGADAHRDLIRLLFQSERYQEAARALEAAMKKYPELEELRSLQQQLIQLGAQRLLQEIELRQQAGQHRYASYLLAGFPSKDVATLNLVRAAEMLQQYETARSQAKQMLDLLQPLIEQVEDASRRKLLDQFQAEIKQDLNFANLPRMADFLRLADDATLGPDERLAIAVSDWLLGQGEPLQNLAVAVSLWEVRDLVRQYLRAMGDDNRPLRQELLTRIQEREGGTPAYVAKLLERMLPPHDPPETTETAGMFHVDVPDAPEEFPVRYDIQLPPEYDPYVRYPAIVTLHAAGGTPESQVTWWAGAADAKSGERRGQAARHGYIVIAPAWTTSRQKAYEYSAREHHVVLASLRDAMRRFSIDSDRVFLSGHALGGDAAWDIGLAHPDLWAGLMVVGARADYGRDDSPLYVTLYNDNAKAFPLYFVFGELDSNKFADNRVPLNRYMKQSGFDPIVVQYQGRGNEHFYEEIQRLFQWMGPQRRDFFPESLEAATMRPWDNYFWYLEVDGLPDAALVSPLSWPPRRARPAKLEARYANNRVVVDAGVSRVTVWLAPRMVDFTRPVELEIINGRDARLEVTPDLETMLEDARTRSDRQHVFWAKVEQQTGRGGR